MNTKQTLDHGEVHRLLDEAKLPEVAEDERLGGSSGCLKSHLVQVVYLLRRVYCLGL